MLLSFVFAQSFTATGSENGISLQGTPAAGQYWAIGYGGDSPTMTGKTMVVVYLDDAGAPAVKTMNSATQEAPTEADPLWQVAPGEGGVELTTTDPEFASRDPANDIYAEGAMEGDTMQMHDDESYGAIEIGAATAAPEDGAADPYATPAADATNPDPAAPAADTPAGAPTKCAPKATTPEQGGIPAAGVTEPATEPPVTPAAPPAEQGDEHAGHDHAAPDAAEGANPDAAEEALPVEEGNEGGEESSSY